MSEKESRKSARKRRKGERKHEDSRHISPTTQFKRPSPPMRTVPVVEGTRTSEVRESRPGAKGPQMGFRLVETPAPGLDGIRTTRQNPKRRETNAEKHVNSPGIVEKVRDSSSVRAIVVDRSTGSLSLSAANEEKGERRKE